MDTQTTEKLLSYAAETRAAWSRAERKFRQEYEYVMRHLLHEAAYNMMSVEQVGKAANLTPKQVRSMMRRFNLNPKHERKMLSRRAAEALRYNSELMGISPEEMDFTSPLAYLPMGDQLRAELARHTTASVVEIEGERS